MFTGLVESLATVENIVSEPPGIRLFITDEKLADDAVLGDSIAINGCCLTVVETNPGGFAFEAGAETLQRTNLGQLKTGDRVNLESSLRLGDKLGGHMVSGHVDGVGHVVSREDEADWSTMWFSIPGELARQMASKASIAVDGVSLTLVDVLPEKFSVALIPHTLEVTTLGFRQSGDAVNLETDVLAKYVEQQLRWKN